jgi:hypothetical protein
MRSVLVTGASGFLGPPGGASKAAGVGDNDQGLQLAQVHRVGLRCNICII